jgi:hypothetical protein
VRPSPFYAAGTSFIAWKPRLLAKIVLDEHGGRKRQPPCDLDTVDQATFVEVQMLVAFHLDSVGGPPP